MSITTKSSITKKHTVSSLYASAKTLNYGVFLIKVLKFEQCLQKSKIQVNVNVPKKKINKAVDRNKIKRLIRNACNLYVFENNKSVSNLKKSIFIAFIYRSNIIHDFSFFKEKINLILDMLIKNE